MLVNSEKFTVTKLRNRFFFHFYNSEYLCFINIPCQNSVKKYPVVLEKKLILLFLLFFSNSGHLGYST